MTIKCCLVALLILGFGAGAVTAGCKWDTDTATEKLRGLIREKNQLGEAAKADAQKLADYYPTFRKAMDDAQDAIDALEAHKRREPEKDVKRRFLPDGRTEENKLDHRKWENDRDNLQVELDRKWLALQKCIDEIGDWNGPWTGGARDFGRVRKDVPAALVELGEKADEHTLPWEPYLDKLHSDPKFKDAMHHRKIKPAGTNTGLLDQAEKTRKAKREKADEIRKMENDCVAAFTRLELEALDQRRRDAEELDRDRNRGGGGGGTGDGDGDQGGGGDDEEEGGPTIITEETEDGGTTTRTVTRTSTGDGDGDGGTGDGTGGGSKTYTVKQGDTLTKIARELASTLGSNDVQKIIGLLYANMETRSKDNPNLIFPGDTINLEAVRRDLAA